MNKRQSLRFDKVFPVLISSDQFGDSNAMARNVSAGGILLEIPEPLFRRAKLLAARDGKTLKQLVNEALEEKLRAAASAEPPWRKHFGKLRGHKAELSKVDAAIAEEFEKIDPDEWA